MIDNTKPDTHSTLPLVEKYRPKLLTEIVSHEEILSTINLFIEKKNIPHLLFHGPPGTGKTTSILAIARELYGEHYDKMTLELNASDDRGINVVRERIKEFCNSQALLKKGTKLVILDESDMMTSAAQFALRRLIEKYTKNARFCLICNQVSKIIPAIQSRCMRFRFSPLAKEQCSERISFICEKEGIAIDMPTIEKLIEIGKGDMRKILNILESTQMSFGEVDIKNIYSCTGLPSDEDIGNIIDVANSKTFDEAYRMLNEMRTERGYSMTDLVLQILKRVRKIKLKAGIKAALYKKFQKLDLLNNMGGNEKVVLTNLITIINDIKIK
jgi:replication factor C subunit 3/5